MARQQLEKRTQDLAERTKQLEAAGVSKGALIKAANEEVRSQATEHAGAMQLLRADVGALTLRACEPGPTDMLLQVAKLQAAETQKAEVGSWSMRALGCAQRRFACVVQQNRNERSSLVSSHEKAAGENHTQIIALQERVRGS